MPQQTDATPPTRRQNRISRRRRRLAHLAVTLVAALTIVLSIPFWAPTVTATAAGPETIWGTATPAKLVSHRDRAGVEVGTRFTAVKSGNATGVRFFKTRANTGKHVGTLWTSDGRRLGTATFTRESASGWQTATFRKPIALRAGTTYVVSYYAPRGGYADTYNYRGLSRSSALSVKPGAGVFRYGPSSRFPNRVWRNSQYWVDLTFVRAPAPVTVAKAPSPTATSTPTPTATSAPPVVAPTPTPTPTPPPTVSAPAPVAPSTPSTGFPNAGNTGVPAGTALTAYSGPCTITTAGAVIDARTINCSLDIRAKGVKITRSVVNGTVYADTDGSGSFTISDSQINIGSRMGTGIGDAYFTAIRVHVTGGNRSINCFLNCTVESSYVHGQFTDTTGVAHESGIRMGSGSVIRGNTIACTAPDVAPDAGCSAALTGYGDFAVVQNNVVDGNLFVAGSGGYCAYGGSTTGKPFSAGVNNIRFTNNVFQRGESGKCGWYGPITSFNLGAPGNVWSNNTFDDGAQVAAAN